MLEPTSSSPPPDGSKPPEWEIEYLARVIHMYVNGRNPPPWIETHVSDTFKADYDNFADPQNWEQHKETFRKINVANPAFNVRIIKVIVDIMEHNTHADCYLLAEALGRPENIRRHSIAKMKWKRRNGQWQLYHTLTIRAAIGVLDGLESNLGSTMAE